MLTHPTHDRLLALGLTGIASALDCVFRGDVAGYSDLIWPSIPI